MTAKKKSFNKTWNISLYTLSTMQLVVTHSIYTYASKHAALTMDHAVFNSVISSFMTTTTTLVYDIPCGYILLDYAFETPNLIKESSKTGREIPRVYTVLFTTYIHYTSQHTTYTTHTVHKHIHMCIRNPLKQFENNLFPGLYVHYAQSHDKLILIDDSSMPCQWSVNTCINSYGQYKSSIFYIF